MQCVRLSTDKSGGQDRQSQSQPLTEFTTQLQRQETRSLSCSIVTGKHHPRGKIISIIGPDDSICEDQEVEIGRGLFAEWPVLRPLGSRLGIRKIRNRKEERCQLIPEKCVDTKSLEAL